MLLLESGRGEKRGAIIRVIGPLKQPLSEEPVCLHVSAETVYDLFRALKIHLWTVFCYMFNFAKPYI